MESQLYGDSGAAGTLCKTAHDFNLTQLDCINTYKVDAQIYLSMITCGIGGVFCIAAFCFLQTFVSVYKGRLWSPQVAIKPPFHSKGGILKYVYWLWPTITLTEKEILATAGLDALMFERLIVLGLQFFLPVCVVSCATLIPLHVLGGDLDTQQQNVTPSTLMRLTMSNMKPGDKKLWVHFVLLYAYCIYGMWLLNHHYKWYVLLRQHYLTRGDSVVPWMGAHPHLCNTLAASSGKDAKLLSEEEVAQQQQQGGALEGAEQQQQQQGMGEAKLEAPGEQQMWSESAQLAEELLATAAAAQQQQQQQQSQGAGSPPIMSPDSSREVSRQNSLQSLLPTRKMRSSPDLSHRKRKGEGHHGSSSSSSSAVPHGGRRHHSTTSLLHPLTSGASEMGHPQRHPRGLMRNLSIQAAPRLSADSAEGERHDAEVEASVAAAIAALGADKPWWSLRYGDPLLDRHVVCVDVAGDMAWQTDDPEAARLQRLRLHRWWELAPPGPPDPFRSEPPVLERVPNTRLMFDHRSLRTRRLSVRFRNTIHVGVGEGVAVPLHVSSYAVLVTKVPTLEELGRANREETQDLDQGQGCSWVHKLMWSVPCMLSTRDLATLASKWECQVYQQQCQLQERAQHTGSVTTAPRPRGPGPDAGQRYRRSSTPDDAVDAAEQKLREADQRRSVVEDTFRSLFPDDFHAVVPLYCFQPVDELLRQWNFAMQRYIQERALHELKCRRQEARQAQEGLGPAEVQQQQQQAAAEDAWQAQEEGQAGVSRSRRATKEQQQEQEQAQGAAGIVVARPCRRSSGGPRRLSGASPATSAGGHTRSSGTPAAAGGEDRRRVLNIPNGHAKSNGGTAHTPHQQQLQQADASARSSPRPTGLPGLRVDHLSGDGGEVEMLPVTPRSVPPLKPHVAALEKVQEDQEGGGCGCCGALLAAALSERPPQEEALEAARQDLVDLEATILEAQQKVFSQPCTDSFIVLFKTPQAATLAASSSVFPQSSARPDCFQVQAAPSPEDVLWQCLWKDPATKRSQAFGTWLTYMVLMAVPTGIFTAAINSLTYTVCNANVDVARSMEWFCKTRFLQFLFTVVLPFVLLMLWQNMVIPQQLYRLELRRAVAVSLSQMERNMLTWYFAWEVINLFLGAVLSASFLSQIHILVNEPESWMHTLGAAFPNSSNFFLNYVILRAFLLNPFRLIMPHGGMWRWIGQMLFTAMTRVRHASTERYRAFIIYPASIRYGREPGLVLLIVLIGMAYSIAAPLMTPFALVYLLTGYILWRYQMLYVCVRCYESGGKSWPLYCKIVVWCLALTVTFTSCILLLKQANYQGVLSWPLLVILYAFQRWVDRAYSKKVESAPLWLAHEAPRTEIDPQVYVPPALQPHAKGWYFEAGKAWVRWGVPPYVG